MCRFTRAHIAGGGGQSIGHLARSVPPLPHSWPYFPGLACDSEVAVAATEGQDLDLVAVDGSVGPI